MNAHRSTPHTAQHEGDPGTTAKQTEKQTDVPVMLREAQERDRENLFQWRNHEAVRAASLNPEPIAWDAHCRWFDTILAAPDRFLLIGETTPGNNPAAASELDPVGVLRYDMNQQQAIVSVYLVPEKMGQGYGSRLLHSGSAWLKTARPETRRILAEIRPENIASVKVFEKAGYTAAGAPDSAFREQHEQNQHKQHDQQHNQKVLRYEYVFS